MKTFTAIAAAFALFAGAAAYADPIVVSQPVSDHFVQIRTAKVFVADLDLTQNAGRNTLKHRVNAAVKAVCGNSPDVRELKATQDWRGCVRGARGTAEQQFAALLDGPRFAGQGTQFAELGR